MRQTTPCACRVPHLRIANVEGTPLIKSSLIVQDTPLPNTSFSWVYWTLEIQATYDADLDFKTFPFDEQNLTIYIVNPFPTNTFFYTLNKTEGTPQPGVKGSMQRVLDAFNGGGQPRVTIWGAAWRRGAAFQLLLVRSQPAASPD